MKVPAGAPKIAPGNNETGNSKKLVYSALASTFGNPIDNTSKFCFLVAKYSSF